MYSSGKPACSCFRGGLRLRSRRCLYRKRRSGTGVCLRSPGRIQRGAAAPLCVVSNRVVLRRARRVKQTCRGHVCSQSGEQTCLRPGQEKSKSSPPECRFSCNFSLDKQREVEFAACVCGSVCKYLFFFRPLRCLLRLRQRFSFPAPAPCEKTAADRPGQNARRRVFARGFASEFGFYSSRMRARKSATACFPPASTEGREGSMGSSVPSTVRQTPPASSTISLPAA